MSTLRFAPSTTRRIGTRLIDTAAAEPAGAFPRERARTDLPSVVTTSLLLITPDNVAAVAARLCGRPR